MENCIFCKIANGQIPSNTLYEDKDFRVIMDISPVSKGHSLIIPKSHYENLFELPEKLLASASIVAKKVGVNIKEKLNADGINIIQNNGTVAGQSVFHYHVHIVPRYINEEHNLFNWEPIDEGEEERKKVFKKIKLSQNEDLGMI